MTRRPRIGITMDSGGEDKVSLRLAYIHAVEAAGGLPWPVGFGLNAATTDGILDELGGIIFIGGDDLDPSRFDQPRDPRTTPLDPKREESEFNLISKAEQRRMPILGICMGCQLMNVHRGGSLIQYLPDYPRKSALEHRRLDVLSRRHPVSLVADSAIARALGAEELLVNTSHKQAIDRVGARLHVTAMAPDGIVEGIEDPSLPFFIGVQWHPERLIDEPRHLAIFKLLADAARRYAATNASR